MESCSKMDSKLVVENPKSWSKRKAEGSKEPSGTTNYTSKHFLTVEEKLTKLFAGECSLDDLATMIFDGIITNAEYDQLLANHKYIDQESPSSI